MCTTVYRRAINDFFSSSNLEKFILIFFFILPCPSYADGYGYTTYYSRLSVNDPDGKNTGTAFLPFNIFYANEFAPHLRFCSELFFARTDLSGTETKVGQRITQAGISTLLQQQFHLSRLFNPWLGAGPVFARIRYTQRYTKDADGYLLQRFPDRREDAIDFVFMGSQYWELNRHWSWGLNIKWNIPFESNLSALGVGLSILHR